MGDYTNIRDLNYYLDCCMKRISSLQGRISSISVLSVLRDLSLLSLKKDLEKDLHDQEKNLNEAFAMLKFYTTFKSEILLPFITEYLSFRRKEEYLIFRAKDRTSKLTEDGLPIYEECYSIIIREDDYQNLMEQLYENDMGLDFDIAELLKMLGDTRYICVSDDDEDISILSGGKLNDEFADFSELDELGYSIVDKRLANPGIEDDELFKSFLEKPKQPQLK